MPTNMSSARVDSRKDSTGAAMCPEDSICLTPLDPERRKLAEGSPPITINPLVSSLSEPPYVVS